MPSFLKKKNRSKSINPFLMGEDPIEEEKPKKTKEKKEKAEKKKKKKRKSGGSSSESDGGGNDFELFPEVEASREESGYLIRNFLLFSVWARLTYVILFCILIGFVTPYLINRFAFDYAPESHAVNGTCHIKLGLRSNCFPDRDNFTEDECKKQRGCCYQTLNPQYGAPLCHHSIPSAHSLNVSTDTPPTEGTWRLEVSYPDKEMLADKFADVRFRKRQVASGHVAMLFFDGQNEPSDLELGDNDVTDDVTIQLQRNESIQLDDRRMRLKVTRGSSKGPLIFDSSFGSVILGQTLSEISFYLPQPFVYGLGGHDFSFTGGSSAFSSRTLFNTDLKGQQDQQHSQPIFMAMDANRKFFGVYVEAERPLEIDVLPGLNGTRQEPLVVFRSMGGYILVHVFTGPSAKQVLQQLTNRLGRSMIPPRWALGYHVCRNTGNELDFMNHINNTDHYKIPFDTDCVDEQYVPTAFEFPSSAFITSYLQNVQSLTDRNKGLLLHHPAQVEKGSLIHTSNAGKFVLSRKGSVDDFEGLYDDKEVVLPDFSITTDNWWTSSMTAYNEIQNAIVGLAYSHNSPYVTPPTDGCVYTEINRTYVPKGIRTSFGLNSICPDAYHSGADKDHLSMHNSYPLSQMEASTNANTMLPQMSYIFSQHSSPGMAKFGGILGSDLEATWPNMRRSLREAIEFGLYGVSMLSMPTCGFYNTLSETGEPTDIDDDLCLRWFQLAAFMPAMHSHHDGLAEQLRVMPYDLAGTYRDWIRRAIDRRYRLIPYFHTLMREANKIGSPMIRPLFLEFPSDYSLYTIYDQFMVGDSILISPVLDEGAGTRLRAYFPFSTWYELWSGQEVEGSGDWRLLEDIRYQIASHIRAGKIIPTLGRANLTIEESYIESDGYTLIVALGCDVSPRAVPGKLVNCTASGSLYLEEPQGLGAELTMKAMSSAQVPTNLTGYLTITREGTWCPDDLTTVEGVVIYGMKSKPMKICVDGTEVLEEEIFYEEDTDRLQVSNVRMNFCETEELLMTWGPTCS